MSYCKEFLKNYRKVVGAKPDEKIDKRYKPYLAPNNKYYDNSHCGYCAEVEYLSEIYDKKEDEKRKDKIHKLVNEILKRIGKIEELADVWEIESIRDTILEAF